MVAGWGSILIMGVTDPLGGINMLFPLFGIANQLLAGIALCVVFTITMKKGLFKWAWVPGLPLFFVILVTMTASFQKIFSSDPKIGYWSLRNAAIAARDSGAQSFQAARTPEQIDVVIRNTFVQGTLSIVYAVLVLIVFVAAMIVSFRAMRAGRTEVSEHDAPPSQIFAPSSFLASPTEREVLAEWKDAGLEPTPVRAHH